MDEVVQAVHKLVESARAKDVEGQTAALESLGVKAHLNENPLDALARCAKLSPTNKQAWLEILSAIRRCECAATAASTIPWRSYEGGELNVTETAFLAFWWELSSEIQRLIEQSPFKEKVDRAKLRNIQASADSQVNQVPSAMRNNRQ